MENNDTVNLLRECNAGVKMGVASIDEVLDNVKNENFKQILIASKERHEDLGNDTRQLLNEYDESGKEPNPMAKSIAESRALLSALKPYLSAERCARIDKILGMMKIAEIMGYLK